MRNFVLLVIAATVFANARHFSQAMAADATSGTVSYYAESYNHRRTASGERFNNNALTAAHRTYPFGTKLRLTNTKNHKSVVVRVNDRGPFVKGREISVTRRAARKLGFLHQGLAQVEIERLK